MDRRSWIILIICSFVIGLNLHFGSKKANVKKTPSPTLTTATPKPLNPAIVTPSGSLLANQINKPSSSSKIILENEKLKLVFTSQGGGIDNVVFKKHGNSLDPSKQVRINSFSSQPIGQLISPTSNLPIAYQLLKQTDKQVSYLGQLVNGLLIKKDYVFKKTDSTNSSFYVDYTLTLENGSPSALLVSSQNIHIGSIAPLYTKEWPQQLGFFAEGEKFKFRPVTKFKKNLVQNEKQTLQITAPLLKYAGISNQFFASVIQADSSNPFSQVWAQRTPIQIDPDNPPKRQQYSLSSYLRLPDFSLAAGEKKYLHYRFYFVSKAYPEIKAIGLGKILNYGFFGFVSRPLNWLLHLLQGWSVTLSNPHSWGLAIIFLTLLIRAALSPFHHASTRTMKRMSAIQPQLLKARKTYKNQPQKLNQETVKLYKEHGVNPMGGCLPVLLQIPIFFGFYRMLQYAVEVREESFLWVKDLSQPDTLFYVFNLPFNLLPILMAVTMIVQMQFTPQTGDKIQRRLFKFMPLIFFFFCYNFAAALSLYWTTQNLFSIGQSIATKHLPDAKPPKGGKSRSSWMEKLTQRVETARKEQTK